ncbi:MAG: zinc-binding dehydrogenase [Alphaproteobacteria bacterium]|nr:zinc-binding dehydrogenase [Alphaproteobacteria bacterium]MBU1515971.1 zinc-binding dehydrogenase [Alphaproteobacteria bacterium]MBU2092814.1 zinc-binding dehydrogenase [Alphaproteobacteria bacterium]MBU2153661.1 zinc-binding dehydrogenase [Alphaproteobacteria bacterium]MBU2308289.1 zinc-binding dehydrogenase [Alphaproteobacteria bacterium]
MAGVPDKGLQLRSIIKSSGELELSLAEVAVAAPVGDEVLVRIEGSPLNPSDLGLLLGPADLSTLKSAGGVTSAKVPEHFLKAVKARLDESLPVGNEGAGVVIAAGPDAAAQALVGKTVALLGGAMYAQYRTVKAGDVLPLPAGASAADGASCFVNPLTALGMTETMRAEGHTALVHTAAASNLGQMLNKICLKDGIQLVNIVRSAEQAKILTDIGAKHVVDSTSANFQDELTAALIETGATIAFDAIGGGKLASQILAGMEAAANAKGGAYSRYGSSTFKQVYIYGGLDMRPTELARSYGLSWSVGGWLLTPFLVKLGAEGGQRLRQRVADELKTTFASHYTAEISLAEALQPEVIAAYNKKTTGEKYLINPAKGL